MAELRMNFANSEFKNIHGSVGSYNNITVHAASPIDILESLNPVKRGHNRSVLPCMDGTRKQVMEEFDQWLKDDEAPNVLWISGHPGVGKSSIAASLESRLANEDERKQSSFFFQRDDVNLTNPAAVWRTVAYDLAQGGGKFADNLVQFLKKKRIDPANVDIASHFRFLIKDPLLKSYDADSPSNTIPIIIIDALDECSSEGSQRWTFLETLTQWKQLPAKFKLIVTSRDEDSISLKLRSISRRISLVSGGEVDPETNGDIRHFFEKRFKDELCCLSLPEWLGDRVLNQLTTQAAGLFIWAETVVKFVRKDLYESQLELVLRGDIGEENHVAELYEKIIKFSFPKPSDDVRNIFKLVVSTIVLAKAPLRIDDVAKILEKKRSEVDLILSRLSSVISGRSTDQCLRIGHLSFTQFICDSKRGSKPDQWFVIDRDTGSQELAMACFRLMKDGLQFNICGLQSSHLLNNDVVDLSQRIEKKISSTLFYSCRFWAAHLLDTTIESDGHGHETLMKEVEDFLYARALFWLEVMSLKKEVTGANIALLTASTRIREELANFAEDFSRFVVNFDIPISTSTPHIYVSALPFAPLKSLVAKRYRSRFPNTLNVISGGDQQWPPVINIFRGHTNWVWSVTFSPDGKRVASGSADKTIRIWDVKTGDVVGVPFEGHADSVYSIAFSPDAQRLASGSRDNTICIWNVDNGQAIADPFKGHTDTVFSVAFSPDGKWVASGSGDNTVRIWDAGTSIGAVAHILEGHTNWVFSVTFSPDGERVASGSADDTIRIWNAGTGDQVSSPFEGHDDSVCSLSFSPNSKRVVSGSSDKTIRIWDVVTGEKVAGPFKGHTNWVNSVAFSPDGKWVVSGSDDNGIRIWNAGTGEVVTFEGHSKSVEAVAFSPDGKHIASGCGDHTIRIWDSGMSQAVAGPFEKQAKSGSPPTLSLDGDRVASGSHNVTFRFWDAETGRVGSPFECHTDVVVFIAPSPSLRAQQEASGTYIALRMLDKTTDQVVPSTFAGQVGLVKFDKDRRGWAVCSDLRSEMSDHGHLFWVPESCREAMCGIETLAVFNKHTTRLDLSQFVHGRAWMQCYDPQSKVPVHLFYSDSSANNVSSQSPQCSPPPNPSCLLESNSEADGSVGQLRVSDRPPLADQSDPLYSHHFQNLAFVLVLLIAVCCFLTISSRK